MAKTRRGSKRGHAPRRMHAPSSYQDRSKALCGASSAIIASELGAVTCRTCLGWSELAARAFKPPAPTLEELEADQAKARAAIESVLGNPETRSIFESARDSTRRRSNLADKMLVKVRPRLEETRGSGAGGSYQLELIRCGKRKCKCAGGELHGPYWYRYRWSLRRRPKTLVKEYVGKPGSAAAVAAGLGGASPEEPVEAPAPARPARPAREALILDERATGLYGPAYYVGIAPF